MLNSHAIAATTQHTSIDHVLNPSNVSENLMPLQFWITLVLGLGMLETTVLFAQYLSWNDYGAPALAVTFIALFFGVLKVQERESVCVCVSMHRISLLILFPMHCLFKIAPRLLLSATSHPLHPSSARQCLTHCIS
jgi:hypothetical protein